MKWEGRNVLVTGAGGFIGSHLTTRLLGMGAHVRAMVHGNMRGSVGYLNEVPENLRRNLETCGGNIRDAAFVREAMLGIDTVYHLAAITSVAYSYANPDETVITNVFGTLNVCNAARYEKVRRVVHTSSAGVYGNAESGPITESHPVAAHNPYTASKLGADHVVQSFHLSYDLPVTISRIFNIYGPRVGRFLVIPTIVLQLLRSATLRLGDLTPTRNYTYVDDIIDAFILMGDQERVVGEVVNFGSPEAITVGQLAELIAELMQVQVDIVQEPKRFRPSKSEIRRTESDATKARELLGWEPKVRLREGLNRTIDWIRAGGYQDMLVT